ncbi:MAG TPA: DUF1028 domain-containing protein [Bacteroidia bacterium]|nr:DUF1028 domain-containing protein [Bacteroidia bacterium]
MKTKINLLIISFLISLCSNAQQFYSNPFAHTFSIVARDSVTGEMGVAVQSHWFSVGSLVGWGEAGVGVIATQSFVNPAYGPDGLKLLKEGKSPEEVVKILTEADSGRDVRQLAVIDIKGRSASYTGKNCIQGAGNIADKNFSVQANLMLNDKVWPAMAKVFKETKGLLAERMVASLEAGQAAGGDIRGKQSASILVVKATSSGKVWEDRAIDLRVEDNPEPIVELKRLLKLFRAYEHMNAGDLYTEKNDMANAMKEYGAAESMYPENVEMKFWHAVTMVNKGKLEEALPLFKDVFAKDGNWKLLIPRLRKAGQLNCNDETEKKILNQK